MYSSYDFISKILFYTHTHKGGYLYQIHQAIVDTSTMRKHKGRSRGIFMEEEEFLFLQA
jgi:hypothetical protein